MFPITDRCAILRDDAVNTKKYINRFAVQRVVYFTLGWAECEGKGYGNPEIWASGISGILKKFTPVIVPHELVVGFSYGDGAYHECYSPENTDDGRELMRYNHISEEDIERFFAFRENPIDVGWRGVAPEAFTEAETWAQDEWTALGACCDSNHSVIGFEDVLKLGLEGLLAKVEEYEKKNGSCSFYNAIKMLCRDGCLIGDKYAAKAKELLESGNSEYSKEDLEHIIATCSRVPRKPAETFAEAIQSLLFAHIISVWEDQLNANSLGHLDQILYPYYRHDIDNGIITKEEAFELICCLWIKLYRNYDVQQSCLGGIRPDGSSMVNELSYLMLDATEQLEFVRCLSVRLSKNTEKAFVRRALEVVGHLQKGVPFFFNDDVMIPALVSKGIRYEDACNYTEIGCVETVIPGKSNPHACSGIVNLLKSLEFIFTNGYSMMNPDWKIGVETGALDQFKNYDEFFEAVKCQIAHIIELSCSKIKKCADASKINSPRPFKSLLTEGCVETATDFNNQGALYDYYQVSIGGIPNLADSLAVIRKFVFEEKKYTLAELKQILEENFPDEAVRMEFVKKAPKYGNDIAEVDQIAYAITDYACDVLDDMSEKFGISYHAQPFTFLWMIPQGSCCAASPDGRRKGEIIAYSVSPMQGRDFNGLTALMNSICCLPTKRTPGTTSAIVEVDPKLFTDSNIDMLTDILLAAVENGLSNVQYNTIDYDTLVAAQKNPEKYNNLAVRVSGFSQKFNLLSPELQNHIIGRTKHTCL